MGTGVDCPEARVEQLNLNLLKALEALLRLRHVTRAAEELNLTQSAISRQLAQLREYFDDPLLIREHGEFVLTHRATELRRDVVAILDSVRRLRDRVEFDPSNCQRHFSFAATDYVAQYIFPDVLARLAEQAPEISLEFRIWQPDMLSQLGRMPLDLVSTMATEVPENLHGLYLGKDSPVCLMRSGHPLLTKQALLEELLEWPFVRVSSGGDKDSFFDQLLQAKKLKRHVRFSVPFFSAAFASLLGSDLVMIVPEHIARNAAKSMALDWQPLQVKVPEHQYYIYWHQVHHHDPAHRWVRELIAEVIRASIFSPS